MAKPKVISVANQKGGVGKSTTVYNLGAGLALDGKKVLMCPREQNAERHVAAQHRVRTEIVKSSAFPFAVAQSSAQRNQPADP